MGEGGLLVVVDRECKHRIEVKPEKSRDDNRREGNDGLRTIGHGHVFPMCADCRRHLWCLWFNNGLTL